MTLLTPAHLPTKTVPFGPDATRANLRHLLEQQEGVQEGVVNPGDFKGTQRAAGANMSVDVAAGSAWIQGDQAARQGVYFAVNDAPVNVTLAAAHPTLPRIDRVICRVQDSSISGASDTPTLEIIQGTPAAGATLDNSAGIGAVPPTALKIAHVLVAAGATLIADAAIRDRRQWAKGAYCRIYRQSNASGASNYALPQLGVVPRTALPIDSVNLQPRIECSGAPLEVTLQGAVTLATIIDTWVEISPTIDGALIDVGGDRGMNHTVFSARVNSETGLAVTFLLNPTAGTHLIGLSGGRQGTGAAALVANPGFPFTMTVRELLRSSANNG